MASVNSVARTWPVSPGVGSVPQPVEENTAVAVTPVVDGWIDKLLEVGWVLLVFWVSATVPGTHGPLAAYAGAATDVTSSGVAQAAPLVMVRRLRPEPSCDALSSLRACQPILKTPHEPAGSDDVHVLLPR